MSDRRQFLAGLAGLAFIARPLWADDAELHIATNQYPWGTFFGRAKRDWNANLDTSIAEVAKAELGGLEPIAGSVEQIQQLIPILRKHRLEMRSLYVNSTLHDAASADASIQSVLAIADAAKEFGCRIIVTNPSPIRWGGPEAKNDDQLREQAKNLDRLGEALMKRGQILAYHNHDAEMKHSAREFHHMMLGTNPKNVTLCLDSHWIYRGSGDSQVALFDIVKLYGDRVSELHLRQSRGGVWTEAFGTGDIDYPKLFAELANRKLRPHLVLEQAVEAKSPNTLDAIAAHRLGVEYGRKTLKVFQPK